MNASRLLALASLTALSSLAMAADGQSSSAPAAVETYDYAQHLDIAHVISMSQVPDVCAVVPARMTYDDSHGQRHVLEYRVMGNGCSNG